MTKADPAELLMRPYSLIDRRCALLATGRAQPNLMTVSWGGFGTIWNRPVTTVYVRPTRYSHTLISAYPEFTLNFLPEIRRAALDYCGTYSGRTVDKWKGAGLQPERSECVAVPRVAGSDLAVECRVIASFVFDPSRIIEKSIEELYPGHDYHTAFIGEVLAVWKSELFTP
ncbi:MAG: flavin reductase family protein [Acidobacteriota bacterium]